VAKREKKNRAKRGKAFYSMLILMIAVILGAAAIGLWTSLTVVGANSDQTRDMLESSIRAYDLQLQNMGNADVWNSKLELLNADGLVESFDKNYGGTLYEYNYYLLSRQFAKLTADITGGRGALYLYFIDHDYFMESRANDPAIAQYADSLVRSLNYTMLYDDIAGGETGFMMDAGAGGMLYFSGIEVTKGVLLLFVGDMPGLPGAEVLAPIKDDAEMYLVDRYGNCYAYQKKQSYRETFQYDSFPSQEAYGFVELEEGELSAYYRVLGDNYLKFVLVMPDIVGAAENRLTFYAAVVTVAVAVIGILLAYVLTVLLYRPLRKLMGNFSEEERQFYHHREYKLLSCIFRDMDERIHFQQAMLECAHLQRLLHGQDSDYAEPLFFQQPDRVEDEDGEEVLLPVSYLVAALRLDAEEGQGEVRSNRPIEEKSYEEKLHVLQDLFTGFMANFEYRSSAVLDGGYLMAVCEVEAEDTRALTEQMEQFKRLAMTREGLRVSVFVSRIYREPRQIHAAYRDVMELVEYTGILEEKEVVASYESLSQPEPAPTEGPVSGETEGEAVPVKKIDTIQNLRELSLAVKALNADSALRLFDEAVEDLMQDAGKSMELVRTRMNALKDQLVLSVYEAEGAEQAEPEVPYAEQIREAASAKELREVLVRIFEELRALKAPQNDSGEIFENVELFVRKHYRDPDFSASMVAEHFGISQSYVTHMFKRYNNTGFLEYLHMLRIEKAQELLRTTDQPVADVAMMVGYSNALTMTRAFKRYTGNTPGSYRKEN